MQKYLYMQINILWRDMVNSMELITFHVLKMMHLKSCDPDSRRIFLWGQYRRTY